MTTIDITLLCLTVTGLASTIIFLVTYTPRLRWEANAHGRSMVYLGISTLILFIAAATRRLDDHLLATDISDVTGVIAVIAYTMMTITFAYWTSSVLDARQRRIDKTNKQHDTSGIAGREVVIPDAIGVSTTPDTGQVFFIDYHRKTLLQKAIALVTGSPVTHVGIVGAEVDGDWKIHEAAFSGWRTTNLSRYAGIADVSYTHFDMSEEQIGGILEAALGFDGTPYSKRTILALLAARMGFTPYGVFERLSSHEELICSEGVALAYFYGAGIDMVPGVDFAKITPGDIYDSQVDKVVRR